MMDYWKELFRPHILERGFNYYETGAVIEVRATEQGFQAVVEGSEDYEVEIEIRDGAIHDMWCTCPYAEDGSYCKHIAAVLYEIEEKGRKGDSAGNPASLPGEKGCEADQELKDVIWTIQENKVREILLELAEEDVHLKNRILTQYTESISEKQMIRLKKEIDSIAYQHSDRYGFVDWNNASDYISAMVCFLNDNVQSMIEKGFLMQAFELVNAAFIKVGNQDMDDSYGESGWLANVCYEYWQEILEHCGEEDRGKMFVWFNEQQSAGTVVDYMEDYLSDFLMNEFHDEELLRKKLAMLDEMIEQAEGQPDCGEYWSAHYGYENNILKRLEIMKELQYTEEEMRAYKEKNWRFAAVRMLQLSEYLEEGKQQEAIELLLESKKLDEGSPGRVAEYSAKLIELYRNLGRTQEYKEELVFQVFHCNQQCLKYVDELKAICTKDEWEDYREQILVSRSGWLIRYPLMEKEGLYERLLEEIVKEKDILYLNKYEKTLKKEFPERVRDIYVQYVRKQAELVSDRKQYKELVQYLKKIRKYPEGDAMASEIAGEWKEKYRRRPAMMDELRKAKF